MITELSGEITAVQQINAVPKILDAVTRLTGMGFVAVARVTSDRWLCCAVRDSIDFGLVEGSELHVETTICNEIRGHGELVVIDDVETDSRFCNHPTPRMYGFRSYISAPIKRANGDIWGTLCAIDPRPRELNRPEIVESLRLFGELIAAHLDLNERFEQSQADLAKRSESLLASEVGRQSAEADLKSTRADLLDERKTSELREQFIGVLGHDLRNPLASIAGGMRVLLKNANSERAPDIIASIQKSVMRMAGLVDNIMDFARGRLGGGLTIRPDANEPLTPVIEHVINEMRLAWPSLNIETDIALNEPVRCDRIKISQLFSNLLGNAVTYARPFSQSVVIGFPEAELTSSASRTGSRQMSVQVEQKSYEMPPREGISIAQFLTVADIERSARYYEKVFGARILSLGDGNAPGYLQLANIWMILNVGGGPTPDKPTVTLSVPDPDHINSFLNLRVADIQACYELWKSRGAEFITKPIPKYGEIRCYIRDPDGYLIEVGQSTDLKYG